MICVICHFIYCLLKPLPNGISYESQHYTDNDVQFIEWRDLSKLTGDDALELFQAVLGGTDSILDYLQTNVEP